MVKYYDALGEPTGNKKSAFVKASDYAALETQNAGLLDQVLELENLRDALEAQLAERVSSASMLSNLLARIHRDGGHYEVERGTEKACADAEGIVARLYATPPAPKVTEEMVERAYAELLRRMTFHPSREQVRAALSAAQEAGKP